MPDIKIKPKTTINKIDKARVGTERIKSSVIDIKEKANNISTYDDEHSNEVDYANQKIQNAENKISNKAINEFNKFGRKSLNETKDNFIRAKEKIKYFNTQAKEMKIDDKINQTIKTKQNIQDLKGKIKTSDKVIKSTRKNAQKGIKTSQEVAKKAEIAAKESAKASRKIAEATKRVAQTTYYTIKATTKAVIKAAKAIATGVKALVSLIIAGGFVSVIVILIICLVGGIVALFNNNSSSNFGTNQVSIFGSDIVAVAQSQVDLGITGGEPYWSWYGFDNRVSWCACFVSWCADQCGLIENGGMPKFSSCDDGVNWFREHNKWHNRGESYYPIIGDIIFFDWKDDSGSQDSISDHVGIVKSVDMEKNKVRTIEGNSGDAVKERTYDMNDIEIMGYGIKK